MAVYKNVAGQKLAVFAYDSTNGSPVTGNAANITAQISLNGGVTAATNDVNPTELDATDAPGIYIFDLTQAETNADLIVVAPVSSTANVELDPSIIYTTPGTSSGVLSLLAPVTHTSAVVPTVTSITNPVTAGTVSDKTGYSLTPTTGLGNQTANITGNLSGTVGSISGVTFPANFGALGINVSGHIARVTTVDTATAVTTVNGLANNVITTASIANGAYTNAKFATGAIRVAGDELGNSLVLTAIAQASQIPAEFTSATFASTGVFATAALANAPSGTDWTSDERTAIRSILGVPGSGTTPSDPTVGVLDTIRDRVVTVDGKADTLLTRIPTALFSGITSMADWIRRIVRSDAGTAGMTTADTEIGGTFDGTTDSLEAIRDRGDAAWTTGAGGGGGAVNITVEDRSITVS